MAYAIGATVFAKNDNHPVANNENHWIGIVTELVNSEQTLGYKCTTVYSDDRFLDHDKVLEIRYSDIDRYLLQSNDIVRIEDDSENNGKEVRVVDRFGSHTVIVDLDGNNVEVPCRMLKLVTPACAKYAEVQVGTKVSFNGKISGFPEDITTTEPLEATVIGNRCGGYDDNYALYIPSTKKGHTCNGLCEDGHGWFVKRAEFDVISVPELPAEPPVEPNNTTFVVGDLVTYSLAMVNRPAPFIGEVVRIRNSTLWLKLHEAANGYIDEDDNICPSRPYNETAHVCAYTKADAANFILLMHDGVVVKHDRFTDDELTDDDTIYTFSEASVYDKGLNIGFPTYLGQDSYDNYAYTCERCGEKHLNMYDAPVRVYDTCGDYGYWCNSCASEYARRCERCGEYYDEDCDFYDVHTDGEDPDTYECWCERCVENHATWCEHCESYHSEYIDCPNCGSIGRINNYSYKPDPQFFSAEGETTDENTVYYGVEDETEGCGRAPREFSADLGNTTPEVYCKHDGSLDNGAEVVTHPCTIRYHIESSLWDRVAEAASKHEMKSHDTRTCGLHVHFSRAPFEKIGDYEEKITLAYDRFKAYWKAISRRRDSVCRWAAFLSDKRNEKTNTKIAEVKQKKDRFDRYQAVNLCNDHTIEIRIFRGTLKVSTIKATLWLVDACNRFILNGGDVETCKFAELIDLKNAPDFVKEYLSVREIPIV